MQGQLPITRFALSSLSLYVNHSLLVGNCLRKLQCVQRVCSCVESPLLKFKTLVGRLATLTYWQERWQLAGGARRPDFLAVSYSRSKIAIVDVCRPSDVRLERLDAAYQGKLAVYGPLLIALGFYIESGWTLQILPWVVGARGLIKKRNMCNALEFLEVPHKKQQSIIEGTVQASIAALAFMHRMRFTTRTTGPGQIPSSSKADPAVFDLAGKGKRKAQTGEGDLGAIMMRWKRMAVASRLH